MNGRSKTIRRLTVWPVVLVMLALNAAVEGIHPYFHHSCGRDRCAEELPGCESGAALAGHSGSAECPICTYPYKLKAPHAAHAVRVEGRHAGPVSAAAREYLVPVFSPLLLRLRSPPPPVSH